jgi:hypothetical protein
MHSFGPLIFFAPASASLYFYVFIHPEKETLMIQVSNEFNFRLNGELKESVSVKCTF